MLLLADAVQVIQVEWPALAAAGSAVGGALVWCAKILASQWAANEAAIAKRHEENRADAREAREENRTLSQAILAIQAKTVETLTAMQREIEHVVSRLDQLEASRRADPNNHR